MSAQSSDLFLMGLLSVTDTLLDRPIEQVLSTVPVSDEIRAGLCGGSGRFRNVYETLLAYERADWSALAEVAGHFATAEQQVPECYLSAAGRATEVAK